MNLQVAGLVGGAAFLLSALAGLLGGVPFFDVLLRGLFWAAAAFGLSLGVEAVLKNLLPDLFVVEPVPEVSERVQPERVDITIEDEAKVFEDDEDDEPVPAPRRTLEPVEAPPPEAVASASAPAQAPGAPPAEAEEEMPEIGAFLDAFKPNAPEEEGAEAAPPPEYAEYAPVDQSDRRSSTEVTIDGEAQDPAILAKAIQTVMKRDGQGT